MQYTLMHKNIAVADMELDEATSSIQRIDAVYRPEHLPVATASKRDGVDRTALNAWWIDRCIPASRFGVRKALETLELPNTQLLLTRCFGLSLSDQYWVRPHGSDLRWERINFFENPFSEDIGDVLLGKAKETVGFDFSSPDNTSDGYLKKRWKIINGKRCLLKAGSNPFMQQPFNEVIASDVYKRQSWKTTHRRWEEFSMNVNRELLAFLRKQYPVGTRIRLDSMQDPYAPVEAGTTGKLDYIDDAGQFHMKWDNGRTLALIPGVDSFTVLPPELSMTKLYMPLTAELYEPDVYGNMQEEPELLTGHDLTAYEDHIRSALVKYRMPEAVSYTHLDVYKRQAYDLDVQRQNMAQEEAPHMDMEGMV